MTSITQQLVKLFHALGYKEIDADSFSAPPNPQMGDIAFACFDIGKKLDLSPVDVATKMEKEIEGAGNPIVRSVSTAGPYINISIHVEHVVEEMLSDTDSLVAPKSHNNKTVLVEYGCPNVLKAFHIGHMKNIFSGESIARLFEYAGYTVKRLNYQGDAGMHIAKAMWVLMQKQDELSVLEKKGVQERTAFLGAAYADGATAFEEDETKKAEIIELNRKVYTEDAEILDVYKKAVAWSLEYFDMMYTRLGTAYDQLFFESKMAEPAKNIIAEQVAAGVLKESQGAVIFPGSEYGLHDRVFLNSQGFPTYEGKDLALSQEHNALNPAKIIHIVGREQSEYFKVVIAAISKIWPEIGAKEKHVPGGFLQLKGDLKMSSRKGSVVTADQLLDVVSERVHEIMKGSDQAGNADVQEKVTLAALKFAMLHAHVSKDVAFSLEDSVSLSGDSGPYLLYIVARINGIITKAEQTKGKVSVPDKLMLQERDLVLKLSNFSQVAMLASEEYNPSVLAQYAFDLAKDFNSFYAACPVVQEDEALQHFRIALIHVVKQVMIKTLDLLGIETVEKM